MASLRVAPASSSAATATIQGKGTPTTPEGIEARKAMETRQEQALRTRDGLINDILNETAVYMAGGDPVAGPDAEASQSGGAAGGLLAELVPAELGERA